MPAALASRRPRPAAPPNRRGFHTFLRRILGLLLLLALAWTLWVIHEINQVAAQDQARPADAIAVFGAAEYNGRPSPVYHARLDHAVKLYEEQIAPHIVTLGGSNDKTSGKSEGGVGRDYLLASGVPASAIIAETHSIDTSQQALLLAAIARANHFEHVVVVSDGTHLFRIRALCQAAGLDVYTSPRPLFGHISEWDRTARYAHEIISYTAMQLHLSGTWFHRWAEGKSDE